MGPVLAKLRGPTERYGEAAAEEALIYLPGIEGAYKSQVPDMASRLKEAFERHNEGAQFTYEAHRTI